MENYSSTSRRIGPTIPHGNDMVSPGTRSQHFTQGNQHRDGGLDRDLRNLYNLYVGLAVTASISLQYRFGGGVLGDSDNPPLLHGVD
jgi:hypothetical protein